MTNAERLDAIAELWPDHTAQAIGEALGLTKNAVCGAVFKARKSGDPRFPVRTVEPRVAPGSMLVTPAAVALPPRVWPFRLHELKPSECRYPVRSGVEKGDHYFCGEARAPGSPYCAEHGEMCVAPARRAA